MTFFSHLLHSLTKAIKDSFPASLFSRRLVKKTHAMIKVRLSSKISSPCPLKLIKEMTTVCMVKQ